MIAGSAASGTVSDLTQQKDHTTIIPKSAKKDLNKRSKAKDKNWWKHQDKNMSESLRQQFEPEYSEAKRRL